MYDLHIDIDLCEVSVRPTAPVSATTCWAVMSGRRRAYSMPGTVTCLRNSARRWWQAPLTSWKISSQNRNDTEYAYAGPFRKRAACQHSAEMSIYIDQRYRQHGIGRSLCLELEKRLLRQNVFSLYAGVTASDRPDDAYVTDSGFIPDFFLIHFSDTALTPSFSPAYQWTAAENSRCNKIKITRKAQEEYKNDNEYN